MSDADKEARQRTERTAFARRDMRRSAARRLTEYYHRLHAIAARLEANGEPADMKHADKIGHAMALIDAVVMDLDPNTVGGG